MRDVVRPLCSRRWTVSWHFPELNKIHFTGGTGSVYPTTHRSQFAPGFHLKRSYGWRKKWRPTTRSGKQGPGLLSSSSSLPVSLALSSRPWSGGVRCTHSVRCPRPCPPHWAKTWEMQLWGWAMARTCWEEMWPMELSSLLKSASTFCSAAGASKRSWTKKKMCWRFGLNPDLFTHA